MRLFTQTEFRYTGDKELPDDDPIAIHRRTDPTRSTSLIVLVHGLGGSRTGPDPTWGRTPEFLFEDLPGADIGLYAYRTLAQRFRFWRSLRIDAEAEVLAGILRDVEPYREIILAGHGMGGLLCMGALCVLIETGQRKALERVRGLILAATPQAGSLQAPGLLPLFSDDAWALRPHGEWTTKVNRVFADHVSIDERSPAAGRAVIPAWAMVSAADAWVDRLSAAMQIRSDRLKIVRDTHTSVVKPASKDHDGYQWLRAAAASCLGRRVEPATLYFESFDFARCEGGRWTGIGAMWEPHWDGVWRSSLENGLFVLENGTGRDAVRYIYATPPVEDPARLAASVEVQVEAGADSPVAGAGLLFRFDPAAGEYLAFTLQPGGRYTLYLRTRARGFEVLYSGRSAHVREGEFNQLAIAGAVRLALRINGELVREVPCPQQLGGDTGVIAMGAGRFRFDNYTVTRE